MPGQHEQNDAVILRTLCFMDGHRIGERQFIHFLSGILREAALKINHQLSFLRIVFSYDSLFSVKHVFFVVVSQLHDFVIEFVAHLLPVHADRFRIEFFLDRCV